MFMEEICSRCFLIKVSYIAKFVLVQSIKSREPALDQDRVQLIFGEYSMYHLNP